MSKSRLTGKQSSLLFDFELDGFEGFVHEHSTAAAALERLAALLAALRPAAAGSAGGGPGAEPAALRYFDRLSRDAAAALQVATTCSRLPGGPPPAGAAAEAAKPADAAAAATASSGGADLRLFLEVLCCCGHDAWLRTGRPADADGTGSDVGSPRVNNGAAAAGGAGSAPAGASPLGGISAPAAPGAGVLAHRPPPSGTPPSTSLLVPPQHTFVVVRAPAAAAPGDAPFAPACPNDRAPAAAAAAAASPPAGAAAAPGAPPAAAAICGGGGQMLVVDPNFRERFASASAAAAAPGYGLLVAALPDVVVGTAEGLAPVVEFMCDQMDRAFRASGTPLPPWREASYMLGAWFPEAADDVAAF